MDAVAVMLREAVGGLHLGVRSTECIRITCASQTAHGMCMCMCKEEYSTEHGGLSSWSMSTF